MMPVIKALSYYKGFLILPLIFLFISVYGGSVIDSENAWVIFDSFRILSAFSLGFILMYFFTYCINRPIKSAMMSLSVFFMVVGVMQMPVYENVETYQLAIKCHYILITLFSLFLSWYFRKKILIGSIFQTFAWFSVYILWESYSQYSYQLKASFIVDMLSIFFLIFSIHKYYDAKKSKIVDC